MFALQQAEPDFELIEPGGIGRQPEHLKVQAPFADLFLLLQPAFKLFRSMGGSIIENEDDVLHLPTQSFRNDLLLHKSLEVDKAFALTTGGVDLAVSDRQSGKQMAKAVALIASFVQLRLAWLRRTRGLLALTSLNGGFFIQTDQPRLVGLQGRRLSISLKHGTSPLQKGFGIMDMLPTMVAPGTNAFGFEPAPHGAGRDSRKSWVAGDVTGYFGPTPT